MSSNYIRANNITILEKQESSLVKLKIRISVFFKNGSGSQSEIAKFFRSGTDVREDSLCNSLPYELCGSNIVFDDIDEKDGNYIIYDKSYIVDESSPRAMEQMSRSIDEFVEGLCAKNDVEEVIVCLFIPSISDAPIIPTLFFQSYPPNCILKEKQLGVLEKINNKKSIIYYFGFDSISNTYKTDLETFNYTNSAPSQLLLQLSALICQYTYFYIDYFEIKDWSLLKNTKTSISKKNSIIDYFTEPEIKKYESFWKRVGSHIIESVKIPYKIASRVFDILCNYDEHLKGRVYNRIKEIVDISVYNFDKNGYKKDSGEQLYSIIENILLASTNAGMPISLYEYFQKCNYWKYLEQNGFNGRLEEFAKEWRVESHIKGFVSGFGALVFTNGKDYICCFKGTDFDSYGRDWILTNVLQGLSGFSLQHIRAVKEAKKLDKAIGGLCNIWFVGHSLGGGLASAATIATKGRIGITFNAAGLNVVGVKVNQLFNNLNSILHPSKSWNRVFPYRIKGEILDTAQKIYLRPIAFGTLERGYGKKSVELDLKIDNEEISCFNKHGINNFLLKESLSEIKPHNVTKNENKEDIANENKVVRVEFNSKDTHFKREFL